MSNVTTTGLFGAVDTLINRAVRDLKYDQTIECIVTSADKSKEGIYTVKSENAIFEAYSDARYYVNDTVYVMVPQGDFKKQKFITGRKVEELLNESSFTLKLPFDDFIGLQNLTKDLDFGVKSYIANHGGLTDWPVQDIQGSILTQDDLEGKTPEEQESIQSEYDEQNLMWSWVRTKNGGPTIETKLAIACNVESLLAHYRPSSGRYGLRIVVTGMTKNTDELPSEEVTQEVYFTNNDMYGNTYAYSVPVVQQKVFDISNLISVSEIKIYFWQDHNFYDEGKTYIPWRNANLDLYPSNLSFSDLEVYLGLTVDEINDERVFLYTYDDITYGAYPEKIEGREALDTRTLHLGWVHRDYANNSVVLVNTEDLLLKYNARVFWYQMQYGVKADGSKIEERLGGNNWKHLEDLRDRLTISVVPSITKSKEKYKAVIYFPGAQIPSDPITFTNIVDVESNNEVLAANQEFIFRFYRPATELEKIAIGENGLAELLSDGANGYLIEDPTIGQFLVYDENNQCLTNSDEIVFSNIDYYVEINLRTTDENDEAFYVPLYTDDIIEFEASFASPEMYSMFKLSEVASTDPFFKAFYSTDNGAKQAQWDRLTRTIKKINIAGFWTVDYNNNILSATVTRNGREYHINKEFVFGQSGSQGSEYTVKIDLSTGSNYAIVKNQEYQIAAYVYDRKGSMLDSDMIKFNWQLIGPSESEYWVDDQLEQFEKITIGNNFHLNGIRGIIRNDYPPVYKVTVIGAADYPITAIRGFALTNSEDGSAAQNNVILCPDRIEYKSDGTQPIYDSSEFEVWTDNNTTLIHPEWTLINKTLVDNKYVDVPLDERKFDFDVQIHLDDNIATNYGMQERYLFTTYALTTKLIKRDEVDRYSWYWRPAFETDYLCLSCQLDKTTWIRQAIAFAHNVYASSLINSWDGSLTMDQENNALLSKMVSAGTKDNDNRFTGVIMGDWQDNADSSLDKPGLYGFTKGVQTFGLRSDGSGFLGASGHGQIKFDGNQALISNYDETCYINLNPILYTFNDSGEFLIQDNTKTNYSPYFLYTKTPRTADIYGTYENLNQIYDKETNLTSWTKPFMEDVNYDYFIVDPNNGVLTTGGVIARYGKIGDWMISQDGLYQKNREMKQFMYLGTTAGLITQKKAIESEYENRKSQAYDNYVYDLLANVQRTTANIYSFDPLHYWNEARYAKKAEEILIATLAEVNERSTSEDIQSVLEAKINEADIVEFQDMYAHAHFDSSGRPDAGNYSTLYDEPIYKGNNRTGTSSTSSGLWPVLGYTPTFTTQKRTYTDRYGQQRERETYIQLTKLTRMTNIPDTYSRTISSTTNTIPKTDIFKDYTDTPGFYFNNQGWPTKLPPLSKWSDGTYNKQSCKRLTTFSIQCINDVLASLPAVYKGYQELYNFQMELQLALAIESVPENIKTSLKATYDETLEDIENEYKSKLETLENEAKNIRYAIFAGEEEYTNPVFYVRWNGDMFARRGLIANTWTIDDHALTYSKNNAIMYLGTEGSAYDGYKPFGRVLKPTQTALDSDDTKNDTRRWAFSASDKAELEEDTVSGHLIAKKPYEINFGVTLAGELYAQKGTIAGWQIQKDALIKYTDDDNTKPYLIKLDSANARIAMVEKTAGSNNPIILLDAKSSPPVAQIGNLGDTALIKLAGYVIEGQTTNAINTSDAVADPSADATITAVNLPGVFGWSDNSGETGESGDTRVEVAATLNLSAAQTPATSTLGTLSLTNPSYFSIQHPDTKEPALRIITSNESKKILLEPIAGTAKGDFGILGTTDRPWKIYASEAYFSKNVMGENILVKESVVPKNGGTAQSGFFPVATQRYVNFRLQELSDYTVALSNATYDAFVSARNRINRLWKAIGVDYDEQGNPINNQTDRIKQAIIKISDATGTGDGGAMTIPVDYTTLGGTGKFTINFNMADTDFYQKTGFGSVKKGSGGTEIGFGMDEDWDGSTRLGLSRAIDINIMAYDGKTVLGTIHVATDGIDPYDLGWKAAAAMYKTSVTNNVITVSGPSSTVDKAATDTTYTIKAAAGVTATASISAETYTLNKSYTKYSYANAEATGYAYINDKIVASATQKAEQDSASATITVNVSAGPKPEIK